MCLWAGPPVLAPLYLLYSLSFSLTSKKWTEQWLLHSQTCWLQSYIKCQCTTLCGFSCCVCWGPFMDSEGSARRIFSIVWSFFDDLILSQSRGWQQGRAVATLELNIYNTFTQVLYFGKNSRCFYSTYVFSFCKTLYFHSTIFWKPILYFWQETIYKRKRSLLGFNFTCVPVSQFYDWECKWNV